MSDRGCGTVSDWVFIACEFMVTFHGRNICSFWLLIHFPVFSQEINNYHNKTRVFEKHRSPRSFLLNDYLISLYLACDFYNKE